MQDHPWIVVETQSEVEEAGRDIGSSAVICMDTEYDSLRYFREKLCLIQIRADRKNKPTMVSVFSRKTNPCMAQSESE